MVKIKRQVEMTHEEYAKYMIDKFGIASYERELIDNDIFDAPVEFEQTFTLKSMRKDDDPVIKRSFKGVVIEVEEEITECTVIPKLVVNHSDTEFTLYKNEYINNEFPLDSVQAFYILNDDLTLTLIWTHDKGLVE